MLSQQIPLNYVRPFEATARLGSTVLAGKELGRNHSNICRYNKLLEEHLGVRLFERKGVAVRLTQDGEYLKEVLQGSLSIIDKATDHFSSNNYKDEIKVQCPTVFANRWILPRLEHFYKDHPNKKLIMTSGSPYIEASEVTDGIHISFEPIEDPSVQSTALMPEKICAVASKSYVPTHNLIGRNSDIRLILTNDHATKWSSWFDLLPELQSHKIDSIEIADIEVAITATCSGIGMMLARKSMIEPLLASGDLQLVSSETIDIDVGYWLVRSSHQRSNSANSIFTRWLKVEGVLNGD